MKYYRMSQDKKIQNGICFMEFPTQQVVEFDSSYEKVMKKSVTLHVKDNNHTTFPEVIEAPCFMVGEEIYKVIHMYEPDIIFTTAVFKCNESKEIFIYKIGLIDRNDCLHENTEFYKDNSLKRLVLDKKKLEGRHITRIKGITPGDIIVSMAVAESVLRRNCIGVRFEEIEAV